MIRNFFTVSFFTLISRLLGFVRDIIIATLLGAAAMAEAFFVAFKIPNFFRRLFAEGAFNAAFVPIFTGKKSHATKHQFAQDILPIMFWVMLIFTLIVEIIMPLFVLLFASGFYGTDKYMLVVDLSRITFPYLMAISLASVFVGILNGSGRFLAASFSPIILNIIMILAIIYLPGASSAHSLSYGVLIAGFVQMLVLLVAARRIGFVLKMFSLPRITNNVRYFFKKIIPAIIGGAVVQVNALIDTIIATFITSAVAFLYYADRIIQLPLALIGTAMGVVLLPKIAKDKRNYSMQNKAISFVLSLTIPAMIGLMVLAGGVIEVLFERGEFTSQDTYNVANALQLGALALPAYALIKIITSVFFANGDTKSPLRVAIIAVIINITLNILLLNLFGRWGVAQHLGIVLATVIASYINIILLIFIAMAKDYIKIPLVLIWQISIIILASVTMGYIVYICYESLAIIPIYRVISCIAVGGAFYAILLFIFTKISATLKKR